MRALRANQLSSPNHQTKRRSSQLCHVHRIQSVRRCDCSDLRSRILFFFFRYFLQPRDNGGKSVKGEELGSLRLNIVYTEDHVFPSEHYTPLRDLLLHSANVGVCVHECVPLCSALLWCPAASCTGNCFTLHSLNVYSSPFSPCRRPQLTFWGRCVERNKKPPFPLCVCFFTMARLCLSSARSLTLKSTAHSECLVSSFPAAPFLRVTPPVKPQLNNSYNSVFLIDPCELHPLNQAQMYLFYDHI